MTGCIVSELCIYLLKSHSESSGVVEDLCEIFICGYFKISPIVLQEPRRVHHDFIRHTDSGVNSVFLHLPHTRPGRTRSSSQEAEKEVGTNSLYSLLARAQN